MKSVYQVYRAGSKVMMHRTEDHSEAVRKANAYHEVHGDHYYIMEVRPVYTTRTAQDDFAAPSTVDRRTPTNAPD